MTITEFLHPLKNAPRAELVQAALFYLKHHDGRAEATASDVKQALTRARVSWARTANIPRELGNAIPYVDQVEARGPWIVTGSGEKNVRRLLGLAAAASETDADVIGLRRLARNLADEPTREYLEEAVTCLEAGARRAAIVFLWSGAVAAIRNAVWRHGAQAIESALQQHNPRAKFSRRADFESVKDNDLIQIAQDLAVYDKSEKKRLREALDLRNDCGHPVKYMPGEKKVSSYIEDIIGIVFA